MVNIFLSRKDGSQICILRTFVLKCPLFPGRQSQRWYLFYSGKAQSCPSSSLTTDLIPNQASHFCTSVITFVQVSGTIFVNQSRIFIRPSPLSTRPMTPIPAPCSWFSCRHLELMLALSSSCPGLLQWFLQFGVHRNHLVVLLKHRLLTPTSKLLYQRSGLEINL